MLARIDGIDADLAAVDEQIEVQLAPFTVAAQRLDDIPGIGPVAAANILAETGTDMSRFPTAGHLCSWAKFSPDPQTQQHPPTRSPRVHRHPNSGRLTSNIHDPPVAPRRPRTSPTRPPTKGISPHFRTRLRNWFSLLRSEEVFP
jgi:hypothetical protein